MEHIPALGGSRPEPTSRPGAVPSIFVGRGLVTLRGLALSNVLLALDYDGTLAPAAAMSGVAPMRGETRRLLVRVHRQ